MAYSISNPAFIKTAANYLSLMSYESYSVFPLTDGKFAAVTYDEGKSYPPDRVQLKKYSKDGVELASCEFSIKSTELDQQYRFFTRYRNQFTYPTGISCGDENLLVAWVDRSYDARPESVLLAKFDTDLRLTKTINLGKPLSLVDSNSDYVSIKPVLCNVSNDLVIVAYACKPESNFNGAVDVDVLYPIPVYIHGVNKHTLEVVFSQRLTVDGWVYYKTAYNNYSSNSGLNFNLEVKKITNDSFSVSLTNGDILPYVYSQNREYLKYYISLFNLSGTQLGNTLQISAHSDYTGSGAQGLNSASLVPIPNGFVVAYRRNEIGNVFYHQTSASVTSLVLRKYDTSLNLIKEVTLDKPLKFGISFRWQYRVPKIAYAGNKIILTYMFNTDDNWYGIVRMVLDTDLNIIWSDFSPQNLSSATNFGVLVKNNQAFFFRKPPDTNILTVDIYNLISNKFKSAAITLTTASDVYEYMHLADLVDIDTDRIVAVQYERSSKSLQLQVIKQDTASPYQSPKIS
jgi:hypothetical protein